VQLDYSRLRPTDVARLLNAETPPDADPVDVRAVRRHQNQGGAQIGEDGRIHLLRYAAWLRARRSSAAKVDVAAAQDATLRGDYDTMKERARSRNAERSAAGRDIGELPPVADPERRERCLARLEPFCLTYLAASFSRPFSKSHHKAAKKIERAVRDGGSFAFAMPRGFGKSTLAKAACLWAILNGLRRFACLIGASSPMASKRLAEIKKWCETNDMLLADFPEVFFPIRKLGRLTGRAMGQTHRGKSTYIEWSADKIVFPTIPGSPASGSVISACGLAGSEVRGQAHGLTDGSTIRPDFVLLDDPQTRDSARSALQTDDREETIFADVMGMADSVRGIAVFAAVTVICRGDLASRLLDRKRHPEFQGERTPLLWKLPSNLKLWDEYARIRSESLASDGDGSEATAFYLENREAMDAGAEVACEEFLFQGEASALQHAMNLRIRDLRAFMAECQNDPEDDGSKHGFQLTVEMVSRKINGMERGVAPLRCSQLSCYVDVHKHILYWVVAAWEPNFTGYILDYGTHPEQPTAFFAQSSPPVRLRDVHAGESDVAVIIAGLDALEEKLLDREWAREDGAAMRIGKMLKDSKWETESVKSQCRRSKYAALTSPAQGFYLKPGYDWYSFFANKPGGQTGYHWRVLPPTEGTRVVLLDTDHWKTMAADRIRIAPNDPGGWSLYGTNPRMHEPFAEHWCSQEREWRQLGDYGKWHWQVKPGSPDDHWWDCSCGCAAAASMLGIAVPGVYQKPSMAQGPRPSLAELARRSR
jgi:hypothetical protein